MASSGFLQNNPSPNLDEIKQSISGNICRCGNYVRISKAVAEASNKLRGM
jgi:aerobic-type carbon monoxide dehydrogenase small subunit (CoxS/CutS family)